MLSKSKYAMPIYGYDAPKKTDHEKWMGVTEKNHQTYRQGCSSTKSCTKIQIQNK